MAVLKRSYSLDERAAPYLDRTAKRVKRSASAVLTDIVAEAARQDARDRALEELGSGVDLRQGGSAVAEEAGLRASVLGRTDE